MPRLTIKNKSRTLVSLSIGQIGPEVQRDFNLSRSRLDGIHRELSKLMDSGQIDFWTDAAIEPNFDEGDEALRGKAAEIDALQTKAAEINGLRRGWASSLAESKAELKEIRHIKSLWTMKLDDLSSKIQEMDVLLRKAGRVDALLEKSDAVAEVLSKAEDVDTLWNRVSEINSVLSKTEDVNSLLRTANEIRVLHSMLSDQVATPLSDVVRSESDRVISCSSKDVSKINDMGFPIPSEGSWLISFEAVVHSPAPAQGFIVLGIGDHVAERPTGKLQPEGATPPIFMTEPCDLAKGEQVSIGWRSSKGSMRMTTRRLTAMKVSSCVR